LRHPAFFHQAARNALMFKPPFRLVGSIYLTGGAAEHPGEINLKDAMMPLVGFARLYAVRHQLTPVHTLDRISAMAERGLIPPASRDEIGVAYEFLLNLRLHKQFEAIEAGRQPQNTLRPGQLGPLQQQLLKQAFAQIEAVQKRINYDFLGGVS
jgi:CBS domain-containing protein